MHSLKSLTVTLCVSLSTVVPTCHVHVSESEVKSNGQACVALDENVFSYQRCWLLRLG